MKSNECSYTNAQGDENLIKSICLKEKVNKENVLVTLGASEGIFISLLSLLNKDDEVIIITPCYPQYEPVVKFCNGKVRYVDTSDSKFIPTYNDLVKEITNKTKVLILNSPANPTGIMYDIEILEMIDNLAKENNFIILCDDVYESLCYKKKIKFNFDLNHTIYLKSFSKSYAMTGYRLGYVITNEVILKQLLKVHSYLTISLPIFIQRAGEEALKLNCINKREIIENLNYTYKFLNNLNIEYLDVDGGIFIFVDIRQFDISSIEFCDLFLEKYHVACVPGICFKAEGFIRINFAVKKEILINGLLKLEHFITSLKR